MSRMEYDKEGIGASLIDLGPEERTSKKSTSRQR